MVLGLKFFLIWPNLLFLASLLEIFLLGHNYFIWPAFFGRNNIFLEFPTESDRIIRLSKPEVSTLVKCLKQMTPVHEGSGSIPTRV